MEYSKLTRFSSYTNASTGATIDYYEVEVKSFEQQVYPGLKKARLVGYDGMSPGPTFRMTRGREAVVRFVNKEDMAIAVHLHGSYSGSRPSYTLHIVANMSQVVAPFDGWAEDTIAKGQYKDYCRFTRF